MHCYHVPWQLHSVHQGRPAHRGPCTMKTVWEVSLSHSGQVRVSAAWWPSLCRSIDIYSILVWELVRLQEPLNRRRREDGLNSTHIFSSKSTTACTEVTVKGRCPLGHPRIHAEGYWKCRLRAKDAILSEKTQLFTWQNIIHYLHISRDRNIHYTHTRRATSVGQLNWLQWTYSEGGWRHYCDKPLSVCSEVQPPWVGGRAMHITLLTWWLSDACSGEEVGVVCSDQEWANLLASHMGQRWQRQVTMSTAV